MNNQISDDVSFYIRITGASHDARINYYYGVWQVTIRRTVTAPSAALAFLKDNLNIPYMDRQTFIVMDENRNVIDDIEPCYDYDATGADYIRITPPEEPRHDDFTV